MAEAIECLDAVAQKNQRNQSVPEGSTFDGFELRLLVGRFFLLWFWRYALAGCEGNFGRRETRIFATYE